MENLELLAEDILTGEVTPTATQLVLILTEASDLYYNDEGESFLSDDQFDALERMLKQIDPKNIFLLSVGSDVRGGKVPLPDPMGSLDQVYEGDTERWIQQNNWNHEDSVLSDKLDGTSGAIYYDSRGNLKVAYSRGNGVEGADITRHIKNIPNVPKKIQGEGAVRVEVILPYRNFPAVQEALLRETGRKYKNPRNTVAGRMNASESPQIFYDNVHVVVTSVLNPVMGKVEQLEWARKNGFLVNEYAVVKGRDLNDEFLTDFLKQRKSQSTYELDGVVIDVDSSAIRNSMRRKGSTLNPAYSRKFKIGGDDNLATTTVTQVLWRASKAGYLKPRVEIKPVDLVGVTITYATGFNAKFIKDQGIGPGATIKITRAGDVIPYIKEVVTPAPGGAQLPTEDEFGEMQWTPGDVDLFLADPSGNAESNLYRIIDIFKHWEVPFLRQGSIEKLIEAGFDTAQKIIRATEQELKDVVGDSAGSKIFEGLRSKLNPITLASIAGGSQTLGRGIGTRKMVKLTDALGITSVEQLRELTVGQIAAVEGFERKTAEVIVRNMPNLLNFLEEIHGYYTLQAPKAKVVGGALDGTTVVFTGVRDKDLEEKITEKGGTIGSGVNKNTTYLVCKDPGSGSSKLKKAEELGVKVIGLAEARELWG